MSMRGTLRSWNDERGFGFIAPAGGGPELFVHITAFPRGGPRPSIGEVLTYEMGRGKNGQPQAVRVTRTGAAPGAAARRPARRHDEAPRHTIFATLVLVLLLTGGGVFAYLYFTSHEGPVSTSVSAAAPSPQAVRQPDPLRFHCDGRVYCSQMSSCAEARFFLNNCPGTKMDGNHDGVPCEQQWCTSPFAR